MPRKRTRTKDISAHATGEPRSVAAVLEESPAVEAIHQATPASRTDARKVSDGPFPYHNVYPPSITRAAPVM